MPSIDSHTMRLPYANLRLCALSVNGFQLMARSGATDGVCGMPRLTSQPATAMTIAAAPAYSGPPGTIATRRPPAIVPSRIATNVPISTRPLPPISSSGFKCCGRIEYLTGPKIVECTPISASARKRSGRLCRQKPIAPTTMIAISKTLM